MFWAECNHCNLEKKKGGGRCKPREPLTGELVRCKIKTYNNLIRDAISTWIQNITHRVDD